MKNDLIVQRAKKVITDLGLLNRIGHIKEYTNVLREDRNSKNYLLKYILNLAEGQQQMNYLFVEKVLKQINLLLL